MIARRKLVIVAGATLAAWPFAVPAQPPAKVSRIGFLSPGTAASAGFQIEAFTRGLAELGYTVGKNAVLEVRYADGQLDHLPGLAAELVGLKVDVVFAPSQLAASHMRKTGTAIPVVFAFAPDPVTDGFIASLSRPGGTMTGLTSAGPDLAAKRVEVLRDALPRMARLAVLYAEAFPGVPLELAETERAARALSKDLLPVEAKRPEELEAKFAEIARWRADALLVIENPMFFTNRKVIVGLAGMHRIPSIYRAREYVQAGGFMSYGADYADLARRAAGYVDRILKGAKPGDLPVEQPVKFELAINLTTAKTLGVSIPQPLLLRADEVIQ